MRVRGGKALVGAILLAGCSPPQSSGILPLDPGTYGLTVTSRNLGSAAEMALSEATGFCTRQGEQTQLLRTQINPGDYQVAFRCVGAVAPSRLAGRGPGFDHGGPAPEPAPILRGQAFAAQVPAPMAPAPVPQRVAMPAGYGALGPSGLPVQPPTLGALMAAARQQARPVPEVPAPRQGWFGRVFGSDDGPGMASQRSFGPSPLPAGMQPFRIPEPMRAAPALETPPMQVPPAEALAPPPPPLQSPLARQPAPGDEPVFAPLPASALAPVAAPRSFENLPPVTGLPGGPPRRELTPLPPVGELPPRAFITDVPARLPPPAAGQAAVGAAGPGAAGASPPAGFWDLRRN